MTNQEVISWLIVWVVLILLVYTIYVYAIYLPNKNKNSKQWKMPKIKDGVPTKYGWVVRHPEKLKLGENTDIGFSTYIQAEYGIHIGKNTQIGSHCSIYSANTIDKTHSQIIICEGARIGSGTVILPKSNNETLVIGKNSKIGAMSLVKDDILCNSTYAGIPAKLIKEGSFYVR